MQQRQQLRPLAPNTAPLRRPESPPELEHTMWRGAGRGRVTRATDNSEAIHALAGFAPAQRTGTPSQPRRRSKERTEERAALATGLADELANARRTAAPPPPPRLPPGVAAPSSFELQSPADTRGEADGRPLLEAAEESTGVGGEGGQRVGLMSRSLTRIGLARPAQQAHPPATPPFPRSWFREKNVFGLRRQDAKEFSNSVAVDVDSGQSAGPSAAVAMQGQPTGSNLSSARNEFTDFFAHCLECSQFEDASSIILPVVAPPPSLYVRVPLRLWTGNPSSEQEASSHSGQPPLRLVRVPVRTSGDEKGLEVVHQCFNVDADGKVSLQSLAEAPARFAADLQRRIDSGGPSRGTDKDDAVRVRVLPKVPSTHRLREAVGGASQEPDWEELVEMLGNQEGNYAVLAKDLTTVQDLSIGSDGKVPLLELMDGPVEASSTAATPTTTPTGVGKAVPPSPGALSSGSPSVSKPGQLHPSRSSSKTLSGSHSPIFIFVQTVLAVMLWAIFAFAGSESTFTATSGLESIFPGQTSLQIHKDCDDLRWQFVWRWFTYQFSHVGLRHVAVNALMNLILGIPLEEFHGTWRMALMYNIGVFGGACCAVVSDVHSQIVGMSGGCYALFGMHLADLVMNWRQRRHRMIKLSLLLVLAIYDILSAVLTQNAGVSHATHFGGYVAGYCIAVVVGKNLKETRWERAKKLATLALSFVLVVFCVIWGLAQWAPREIWEDTAWCWTRQVSNSLLFGDNDWYCVRCDSEACVEKWQSEQYLAAVTVRSCEQRGGWIVSER